MTPLEVSQQTAEALSCAIDASRAALGTRVTLVGHHYQHQNVVNHCDFLGDSLELARRVAGIESEHIVFCGVYFMAESAALLARPGQQVHIPDPSADCVMARMTPAPLLDRVLTRLTATGRKLIPLAYVNTSLAVKGVVGRHGGAVCTSANAEKMLDWALRQGDGVLFLPDKNLAVNTARTLGITGRDAHQLDIRKNGDALDLDAADKAMFLMWPGLCSIHARFSVAQIEAVRAADPDCRVVVHPECSPAVVRASDAAGSTSFIIKYVANATKGSHIYIGTESNLVQRLAREVPHVRIEPLFTSSCSHMAKVTPAKLLHTLEHIANGTASPVLVDPETALYARSSLERMLEACQ
ncbi:MAG: quinolinate synthase NadA [Bilophila sp.]